MNSKRVRVAWPSGISFRDRITLLGATCGGIGLIPLAPGTWGSLPGIPIALVLELLPASGRAAGLLLFCILAIHLADRAVRIYGCEDASPIVIDEAAGMTLSLAWADPAWHEILFAFIVFRLLDIWKPCGIRWLEKRFSGGRGVVVDDLAAGLATNLILMVSEVLFRHAG